jgi:Family of unknown function (DUF5677)
MHRYLGPSPAEAIAAIRQQGAEWFALAEDVAAYVGSMIERLQVPPGNDRLLLAAVLLRRIAAAFEAVIVLAERGMHTEGLAMRRALLEALFVLGAIHNQPALVETYMKNDEHRRRDIFKKIKKLSPKIRAALPPELTPDLVDTKIAELESSAKGTAYLGPEQYAQAAKLYDQYLTDYSFLSEATHHAAKDLERNVSLGPDGLVNGVYWGPEPDAPAALLSPATEHTLVATSAALAMFALGQPTQFTELFHRAESMFEAFVAAK